MGLLVVKHDHKSSIYGYIFHKADRLVTPLFEGLVFFKLHIVYRLESAFLFDGQKSHVCPFLYKGNRDFCVLVCA